MPSKINENIIFSVTSTVSPRRRFSLYVGPPGSRCLFFFSGTEVDVKDTTFLKNYK